MEDVKGTLGIPLKTTLDDLVVLFTNIKGLITLVLVEMVDVEVKFNATTGVECVLDIDALTFGGNTPPDNIAEVGGVNVPQSFSHIYHYKT